MNILNLLQGKKTYIICIATIVYAILGVALGQIEWNTFITLLGEATIGLGLRSAVSNK